MYASAVFDLVICNNEVNSKQRLWPLCFFGTPRTIENSITSLADKSYSV